MGMAGHAEPSAARPSGHAEAFRTHSSLYSDRRVGSADGRGRATVLSLPTCGVAGGPVVGCEKRRDLSTIVGLPRHLSRRNGTAARPRRQNHEGTGRSPTRGSRRGFAHDHRRAAKALDRPLLDRRTTHKLKYLFLRRGRPMSTTFLFAYALLDARRTAGLVDANGRPVVTAHRFRHTVGTQLAEHGAKLHTIMSVLGHESPHMSMIYARISDAEVLRDYRAVLGPGAVPAGAGAEAIRTGRLGGPAIDWATQQLSQDRT